MPHIIVEHGGVDYDLSPLFAALVETICDHPEVKPEAVKLRAIAEPRFLLVTGEPGFVHVTLRLMEGRPDQQHEDLADRALAAIRAHLPPAYAVSVETAVMRRSSYRKYAPPSD